VGRPGPLTRNGPAGSEVVLRLATSGDQARLLEWRNEPEAVRFSSSGRPVDASEHAKWLAARLAGPGSRLWVAEEAGEPVGQVRVDLDRDAGTVSISVSPAHRGRGVGSRMLQALIVEMEQDAEVRNLLALVHSENIASLRAFERVGFHDTGRRRRGFVVLERSVEAKP
jgi:UDP-2,4-diacetamido-2,4,6-trideoxy-beta-L-altropyranose hydrolase